MISLLLQVQKKLQQAIVSACGTSSLSKELLHAEVTQSTQEQFGHYQCNSALKIGKALKTPPKELASSIASHVDRGELIDRLEIAGPGFINIFLRPSFLAQEIDELLLSDRLGVPPLTKKEKVIVEFSSPNIAKELHVGHLRSTIIGDCLANLFEFLGHDVLRLNHVGDWGTQFGMLIAHMEEVAPKVLEGSQGTDLVELMHWYRESKRRFDEDPLFKKRAQLRVVDLQSGEEKSRKAWEQICEISREAFHEIYSLLDVCLNERGESFYNSYLPGIVKDLEEKGLVSVSGGAKCLFLEGFVSRDGNPLPMIIQKSDGGYNYDTTDMAALYHRIHEEKADRIIIVTDAGQSLHFEMLFKAGEKAGYFDRKHVRLDHVPFGVVLGPDGKKFKTRSGETEKLIDLLWEAIRHAKKIVDERLPQESEEERSQMAHTLGIDAIKYADLSCHRIKDYFFSYERMLKFEGNTAIFLLYAYVRIQGIKRKVGREASSLIGHSCIRLEHPTEISLALHLRQFGEVLETMTRELLPNRLCDYLYILAEKFNAFFRDCRVEGSDQEESRFLLCEATSRILKKGLNLLGLKVLDKM